MQNEHSGKSLTSDIKGPFVVAGPSPSLYQVRKALAAVPEPDAIIEAVPDLVEPAALARALAALKAAMPSQASLELHDVNGRGLDPVA